MYEAAFSKGEKMYTIRLTKQQKKERKKLNKKIQSIKKKAREDYPNEPHRQIKHATEQLREFYCSENLRENQTYLLQRYTLLEKRESIWNNIWFPAVISILSLDILYEKSKGLIAKIVSLGDFFVQIPALDIKERIFVYIGIFLIFVFLFLLVYSFGKLCKLICYSLTRNADSSIIDNEKCIIKALLSEQEVLLDEGKELERARGLFKK